MARLSASSSAISSGHASNANGHISVTPSTTTTVSSPTHKNEDDTTLKPSVLEELGYDDEDDVIDTSDVPMDESLFPGGSRDLSRIGVQAFALGNFFSAGLILAAYLVKIESLWWRLPAFTAALAFFHFMEYWTQARYNTPAIRADSFLLFTNGWQYNTAHSLATVELVLSCIYPAYGQAYVFPYTIAAGLALVFVGQFVRSLAMAQAGVSFNHVISRERKDTHKLVTHGIYRFFRHPSYFGFFWWALGTQLMVGNKFCVFGYGLALWGFFSTRIRAEERLLSDEKFFGKDYLEYKKRTGTMIPFIP
ncbi:Protein-S-isoprenylcysteine O-methyltransferase [Pseudocercospora fuligena]|uniref:Protein-S-isoprenylcysteine O-methyltransferase n=1 Tax=Pseudocercospora fuligena TaxID=685502 RepID=A0A8H6VFR2_9PEZI|nr:Protein-S-isoprenylcysteine O-methyltransferase [Pseudocercospora fuligena]